MIRYTRAVMPVASMLAITTGVVPPSLSPAAPARFAHHPIITEVLFAVPTYEGDANLDGTRQAVGDEFVELMNPHDVPIQLAGYTLTDRNPPDLGQVRFRFPTLELKPGEIAVVFNGHGCEWIGPVGDDRRAPPGTHDLFHNAWVFTMRSDSEMTGFANSGDWVLLSAPDGSPVECVRWGRMAEVPPVPEGDVRRAPETFSESVVRGPDGSFRRHTDISPNLRFSPGKHQRQRADPGASPGENPAP